MRRVFTPEQIEEKRQAIYNTLTDPTTSHEQKVTYLARKAEDMLTVLDEPEELDALMRCGGELNRLLARIVKPLGHLLCAEYKYGYVLVGTGYTSVELHFKLGVVGILEGYRVSRSVAEGFGSTLIQSNRNIPSRRKDYLSDRARNNTVIGIGLTEIFKIPAVSDLRRSNVNSFSYPSTVE